jgi:hypothetical protein
MIALKTISSAQKHDSLLFLMTLFLEWSSRYEEALLASYR